MVFNKIITHMKYSTVFLSGVTMLLSPELKHMCLNIISIILLEHFGLKFLQYLYSRNINYMTNNYYSTIYVNFVMMIKICCIKFISSNIPLIKNGNYNYLPNVCYELLNIFWKTYSNILYALYACTIVTCVTLQLSFPIIKNYISNLANQESVVNFRNLITTAISNINREQTTRINITIDKLDEICPLRCKKLNNVSNNDIDECCICKEKYNDNELHRKLPCNHTFHAHCIEDWIIRNKKCPLCRYELQI